MQIKNANPDVACEVSVFHYRNHWFSGLTAYRSRLYVVIIQACPRYVNISGKAIQLHPCLYFSYSI